MVKLIGISPHASICQLQRNIFYNLLSMVTSPNPMAVPKLFLKDLKKRTKTTFRKKSRKIKIFVFETAKVKVQ